MADDKPLFTEEERKLLAQQKHDMAELYPDGPEARELREQAQKKEVLTDVTPEQKARVDQALSETNMSKDIGGASDVSGKPVPNEPTPLEKARDAGQDLHKAGVTMDHDK